MKIAKNVAAVLIVGFVFNLFRFSALAAPESALLSVISPTPAVEYSLPYPGLLPDHPLYLIKALRDRILLFVTSDQNRQSQLNLLFADKRIAMGQILWDKGNIALAGTTFTKAEKYLLSATINLSNLKKQNMLPPGSAEKMEMAAKKHEEIILKLIENDTKSSDLKDLNEALGINHQAIQQISSVKQ